MANSIHYRYHANEISERRIQAINTNISDIDPIRKSEGEVPFELGAGQSRPRRDR
jgi:hypothetical protein